MRGWGQGSTESGQGGARALTYDALAEAGQLEDGGRVEEHRVDPCAGLQTCRQVRSGSELECG